MRTYNVRTEALREDESQPCKCCLLWCWCTGMIDSSLWWHGPDLLWNSSEHWNFADGIPANPPNDREVNKVTVRTTQTQEPLSLLERLKYFSIWHRAKGAIAVSLCLQQRFRKVKGNGSEVSQCNQNNREERKKGTSTYVPIDVQDLQQVEQHIIKTAQNEIFRDEIQRLKSVNAQQQVVDQDATKNGNQRTKKSSSLHKVNPFIDENGLLRVGGRISLSSLPYDARQPIILPKEGHVTDLILCHFHQSVKHQGTGVIQNEIRSARFWNISGSSVVSHHISKCVSCQRLRSSPQDKKMSDLAEDRLEPAPPLTICAVDYFGLWLVKH